MTVVYILLSISVLLSGVSLVVLFFSLSKKGQNIDIEKTLKNEGDRIISEYQTVVTMYNTMVKGALEMQQKLIENSLATLTTAWEKNSDRMNINFVQFNKNLEEKLEKVREDNSKSLAEVRLDNEKQLNKMRETVDQKLSATLEERFNASFKMVEERLDSIRKMLVELDNLQTGMRDLKKVFSNIKDRGTWGEVHLESLLTQILAPEQFSKNVLISKRERVDFAINLPGKNNDIVLLPIDAKFPVEDYQRLVEATENGDREAADIASKAIESRIKREALSIKSKYISPPKTTDFAIMYLPSEGLFAEVLRRPGLSENLQNNCQIVVCGPTTLAALLNSLQMGFRTLAIEKRSTEVWKLLSQFQKDFGKFSQLLFASRSKLQEAVKNIDAASLRSERIQKKLQEVEKMPFSENEAKMIEDNEAIND